MLQQTFHSRVCQQFVQGKLWVESLATLSNCAISRALESSAEQFPKTDIDQDFVSSSGWWLLLVKIWVLPCYIRLPIFLFIFPSLIPHQLYHEPLILVLSIFYTNLQPIQSSWSGLSGFGLSCLPKSFLSRPGCSVMNK